MFYQSHVLPKSCSTKVMFYQSHVLLKSCSTKVMFYKSHVLSDSRSTKVYSTKVRICKNEFYQSPDCLKRGILPNSVLSKSAPPVKPVYTFVEYLLLFASACNYMLLFSCGLHNCRSALLAHTTMAHARLRNLYCIGHAPYYSPAPLILLLI
jgi:hypothetical protein